MEEKKWVRYPSNNGHYNPCSLLGTYTRESLLYVYYRSGSGKEAYISKSRVHVSPCKFCPDNRRDKQ